MAQPVGHDARIPYVECAGAYVDHGAVRIHICSVSPKIYRSPHMLYLIHLLNFAKELRYQVKDQVRGQVWGQVGDQVGGQVEDQVRYKVREQVRDQVRDQVGYQVGDQVGDQVWDHFMERTHVY